MLPPAISRFFPAFPRQQVPRRLIPGRYTAPIGLMDVLLCSEQHFHAKVTSALPLQDAELAAPMVKLDWGASAWVPCGLAGAYPLHSLTRFARTSSSLAGRECGIRADGLRAKCQVKGPRPYISNCGRDGQ
jgi:hypothetical protein